MKCGIVLASLLICCCVNHLWAAALHEQSSVQPSTQLAGIRADVHGLEETIAPSAAAIIPPSTQRAARSFQRARKLLTATARTQQRKLRQIFVGGPFINPYTLYDTSSGTWWQAYQQQGQQQQQQQEDVTGAQTAAAEQNQAPGGLLELAPQGASVAQDGPQPAQGNLMPAAPAAVPEPPQQSVEQPVSSTLSTEQQQVQAAAPPPAEAPTPQPTTPTPPPLPASVSVASLPTATATAQETEAEETAKAKDFDSWNTSPVCNYPKTADNYNLDKLGRPWGFDGVTKQSCTFKDASAPYIAWDDAKDCPYKLTDDNNLPDNQGHLWGFDGTTMQSCAFKSQSLPAGKSENGETSSDYPKGLVATAGVAGSPISNIGYALALLLSPLSAAAPPPGQRIGQIAPDLGTGASSGQPQAPSNGAYCIPVERHSSFHVLAAGDSITQGSVPSRGFNYPYAIKLEELLRKKLGPRTRAIDAGLGGGGIFQTGFSIPKMFPEFYREQLGYRKWDVAVVMIGINDLLRGGTPAADIMTGLQPLLQETLAKGVPIISIPPFAAPGFVVETDSKEAERKKMAELLKQAAESRAAATGGQGPQIWVLDLESGPLDFYKMSPEDRSKWLDDGLHMTQYAYEQLGQYVYDELIKHLCEIPQLGLLDYAQASAQEASYSMWRNAARARP